MTGLTAQGETRVSVARRAVASMPWRPVLASYLAARAVVLVAVGVAAGFGTSPRAGDGLLAWDSRWYEAIAAHGYAHIDPQGIRFFPLLPLLARWLAVPLGGDVGVSLVVIGNVAALAYALLVYQVATAEGMGKRDATVVVWAASFVPAGFVLVMGYTESLFGVFICIALLGARRRRWLLAAVAAVAAGLLKPTGVLLAVPIAVEAWNGLRCAPRTEVARRLVAVFAAPIGLFAYLLWCDQTVGSVMAPLRAQTDPTLRGGVAVDPVAWIVDSVRAFSGGDIGHAARLTHLIWAAVAVYLLVRGARRLPLSYTCFTACSLLLALTSHGMSSFERYAGSTVPLLLVVPSVLNTERRRRRGLVVAGAVLLAYSLAAFFHGYVP